MANAHFYSNTAQETTLAGSISAGATSIGVSATTGFPGSFPYTLAVDYGAATEELVSVTAAAGTTLTVTRGFSGTSAQSHSLGAVVRHVYHAGDATDFRTHEAATAAVHGVTGTLVGTSDTQTLTNKTINGGVVSGTFTGAASFTGGISVSGGPTLAGDTANGTLSGTWAGNATFLAAHTYQGAAATNTAVGALVTGDGFDRFRILADGDMEWGPGNAARDVQLYRDAASVLATNDTFRVYGATTTTDAFQARVTGDTVSRLNIDADGGMSWGPGGASAQDTNLYRNAADELKTDDNLTIAGNLAAANIMTGAWTSYTPTWTAETGTNPTLGNGTLSGTYYKVGRFVALFIRLVWGSTSAAGSGAGSENWVFGLPVAPAAGWNGFRAFVADARDDSTGQRWGGRGNLTTSGSGGIGTLQATDHSTTAVWDSVAPFTWATSDSLQIIGFYESAA